MTAVAPEAAPAQVVEEVHLICQFCARTPPVALCGVADEVDPAHEDQVLTCPRCKGSARAHIEAYHPRKALVVDWGALGV